MGWLKSLFGEERGVPPLTDRAAIDALYRRSRRRVIVGITAAYGLAYTCRLPLSVVKKPLLDGGLFSASDLGLIGSAMLYAYGFGKLVNGFLADHASIRRFFAAGLLCSALINVAMGGTPAILVVWALLWSVNGWFQGFGAPASAVALSAWFGGKERGTFYGIWSMAHAIGEGLTFFATAAVVTWLGWRAGFVVPGLLCVGVAAWVYWTLPDRPQSLGLPPVDTWQAGVGEPALAERAQSPLRAQLEVFGSLAIWIMGLANAALYVSRYSISSWGVLYLQEARGYSLSTASLFLTVNTVAGVVGSAAFGWCSDRFFRSARPPVNLAFGLLEVGAMVAIFALPGGHPWLLGAAFAAWGFSLSGVLASLGGLFAMDVAPRRAAGAAMGFIGVFGYLGAAVQDYVSGVLIDRGTTVVDGVRHYDFSTPAYFWVSASVVSVVLATSLWRVRARS